MNVLRIGLCERGGDTVSEVAGPLQISLQVSVLCCPPEPSTDLASLLPDLGAKASWPARAQPTLI
ncbi:MAG: hypothetical protein DLM53_08170 [Candidatus Eremiobacter antarcticus]|nr:MAG: hypothetical protein DLM53_08170 [Candidatus Eremiobacter sp. RRmetagenome_bin22]